MAQTPTRVDQIDIEPGLTSPRRINKATDGSLQFMDPSVTVILSALVGVRNITGLFIVGRDGDGAPYTSIQDALDAIPDTSSVDAPSVVLVGPGGYAENLTVVKDGVYLIGLGRPRLTSATATPVISIEDTALSTPENVVIRGFSIENTAAGGVCVGITGAGTFASGIATVVTAPLAAGDTLTIGGTVLTGVVGARDPGSDDFSIDSTTVGAMAIEIAAAINDPLNSFAVTVEAATSGAVVTITAITAGAGGNAITLATLTAPAGGITVSGANLTGGGSDESPVALGSVDILDSDLIASGVGGFQIDADTVNNIRVEGGTWRGSASNSLARVIQCAAFRVDGVEWTNDFELAYDTGNDQPDSTTSEYRITHCGRTRNFLSNLIGAGSLLIGHCPEVGTLSAGGDRTLVVSHCRTGTVSLEDTVVATFANASRGTASVAGGTPTLAESSFTGSVAFVASASQAVSLQVPGPNATYAVLVDSPDITNIPQATVKAAAGFTLTTAAPISGTVFYTVMRQL